MRLLDFERAPNPKRVRLFLAEKEIDIQIEQVDVQSDTVRHAGDYFSHTAAAFRDRVQVPAFAKSAQSSARAQLDMLDRALSERPFVAADTFSIADITSFVAIDLGVPSVFEIDSELGNIQRWYDEIASRPDCRRLYATW